MMGLSTSGEPAFGKVVAPVENCRRSAAQRTAAMATAHETAFVMLEPTSSRRDM